MFLDTEGDFMNINRNGVLVARMNEVNLRLGFMCYTTVDTRWRTRDLATPFNRLYLIREGRGLLQTEKEQVTLEPGRAYLLPAGVPCSYCCEDRLTLLAFHFDLLRADQTDLLEKVDCLPVVDFEPERIEALHRVCQESGYGSAVRVINTIQNILLDMSEEYPLRWDDQPAYSPCVARTIARIHETLSAQLRIEELAQQEFISRSYLSRQFCLEVGMPVKRYVHMQLVNMAQWRLINTADSVEKISNDLGFCNPFYFSEFFKKRCRVSPLQYRNGTKY